MRGGVRSDLESCSEANDSERSEGVFLPVRQWVVLIGGE